MDMGVSRVERRTIRRKAKQSIREFSSRMPLAANDATGNPWQDLVASDGKQYMKDGQGTKRRRFCL